MSFIRVDDFLADPMIVDSMEPDFIDAVRRAATTATATGMDQTARFGGFQFTVAHRGEFDVQIYTGGQFRHWVAAAGELARYFGPDRFSVDGATVTVEEMLDGSEAAGDDATGSASEEDVAGRDGPDDEHDEDDDGEPLPPARWGEYGPELSWAAWSSEIPEEGEGPDVSVATPITAYRCDNCGAVSTNADDFRDLENGVTDLECNCGAGGVVPTRAVQCDACDTLILLHDTPARA